MNSEVRILEPGQIETPAGEIRFLILPEEGLFARRAERFRQLAHGHPLGGYLSFLALLADAQQEAVSRFPDTPHPGVDEQDLCRRHGLPLLSARSWHRHPSWREALAAILLRMSDASLPSATRETATALMQVSDTGLEEMADRILSGRLDEVAPQELPFIAAALQVYWVSMAAALGEAAFGRPGHGGVCPVCGSYPTAGVVCSGGAEQGLRYLSCSLCASRWHLVRLKCSSCESTQGIQHYILEGSDGAVKAECCDSCGSYLKLLYLEKESRMEPLADDLATLSLDMLMDTKGIFRYSPNLLYHPGRSH